MTRLLMVFLVLAAPPLAAAPPPAPAPPRSPPRAATIDEIAASASGTVGFAALDLASGRTLGLNERRAFPTQSVFKLPIAIEVLRQVDDQKVDLARVVALVAADARGGPAGTMTVPAKKTVRELLEAMLVTSDNVACDKLLALVGGPRVVGARVHALGVEGIDIRYAEVDLGTGKVDNTATPSAIVTLLAKIARRQVFVQASTADIATRERAIARLSRVAWDAFSAPAPAPAR